MSPNMTGEQRSTRARTAFRARCAATTGARCASRQPPVQRPGTRPLIPPPIPPKTAERGQASTIDTSADSVSVGSSGSNHSLLNTESLCVGGLLHARFQAPGHGRGNPDLCILVFSPFTRREDQNAQAGLKRSFVLLRVQKTRGPQRRLALGYLSRLPDSCCVNTRRSGSPVNFARNCQMSRPDPGKLHDLLELPGIPV